MRSLRPEQLVLLLVFVLVPLLNLLVRWIQQRARERAAPLPDPAPREARTPGPMPRVRTVQPAAPCEGPAAPAPAPPPPPRRRAGPLGGPAGLRRAIVAMTILGPCRGLQEHQTLPPRSKRG